MDLKTCTTIADYELLSNSHLMQIIADISAFYSIKKPRLMNQIYLDVYCPSILYRINILFRILSRVRIRAIGAKVSIISIWKIKLNVERQTKQNHYNCTQDFIWVISLTWGIISNSNSGLCISIQFMP